ncbi:protein TESPA1 isoform X4 [Columba livia]|uniref:protein TESPA1 isoform X4 n=1 Tax=Columba livia TaxID=8932 RepID=UPI0031BA5272
MSLWSPHVTALMLLQGDPPPGAAAMEGTSVLSPSWWEKRRAWARQSRSWRPTAPDEDDVAPNEDDVAPDEDEVAPATRHVPELPAPDLDDVFLEGSPSRKIETWLQECGSLVEEPGSPGPLGCENNGTSFEDDLTLGAEALLLLGSHEVTGSVVAVTRGCPPRSVAAVLAWRQEDAEEILVSLGFARSEPGAMARVPPRFLATPSRARGMDVGLFLRAQVQRLETEEPGLALAGRFQQAQALAVTADTFFCLYSYVSRIPVRCICPPHPAWPCPRVPDTRVSPPAQPTILSPIERLKKVVSTMSLYVSPRNGDNLGDKDNLWDGDNPWGTGQVSPVSPALGKGMRDETFGLDVADVPTGWGGDGNTGTVQHPWGATRGPQVPLSPHLVWGVPMCPHHCGGEGEQAMSPGPTPAGTLTGAVWGHAERCCPHGSGDSPTGVTGEALCPPRAGQGEHQLDAAAGVTLSPALSPPSPYTKDPQDSMGTRSPSPDTPRTGGRRSGNRHLGGPLKDTGHPPGKVPVSPCPHWQESGDSFELEELPSTSEDDDDDNEGDTHEESGRSLCPSITIRRSFMLHGGSGRSDSSGFVEEPVWGHPPARLCDTDQTA